MSVQLALSPLTHEELNSRADRAIRALGFCALVLIRYKAPIERAAKYADEYELYHSAAWQRTTEG